MAMGMPRLIYCADGNKLFANMAVNLGWLYGARLPATVYERVYFADQDWKKPDRTGYMMALASHTPVMATVLDLEREDQFEEVIEWMEEASGHVTESILLVLKVQGITKRIPRKIGGKRVVLAYSVASSYGKTTVSLTEFYGWPVHLLGGSPQAQMRIFSGIRDRCNVISADGNMAHLQAHRCRTWTRVKTEKGHWNQLSRLGEYTKERANLEAFRRSLIEIKHAWELLCR